MNRCVKQTFHTVQGMQASNGQSASHVQSLDATMQECVNSVGCAEMRDDLADYAGMGWRPGGLCLTSLQGPHSTDNFWTMTLVSLQYLLGLTLTHSIVTRIPPVSSTSAPSPKSRARGHFSLPTLLPQFPLFLPFDFLDLFFILFPSLMLHTLLIEQSSVV